jgi:hypothetical protein
MSEFLRYKVYDIKIYNKSYIGCTGQLPNNRLQQHLECCHAVGKTYNQEFYSSLLAWQWQYKSTPIMKLHYQTDNHIHALLMEVKIIRDLGTQIVGWNGSPGGEARDFHVKHKATPEDVEFIFGKNDKYFYEIFNKNLKINEDIKIVDNKQQRFLENKFFSAYKFETKDQNNFYARTSRKERRRILQKFKKEGMNEKMDKLVTNYVKRNIL